MTSFTLLTCHSNSSKSMEEAFKINNKTNKSCKRRNDTSVQGTNDSSILSKISCCESGYFEDDFLKYFASKIAKRSSLVNRGYYIRAKIIDFAIKEFLSVAHKQNLKNQIVNLGAGFDSTFFRLKHQNLLAQNLFIEIDFPDVINRKINLIKSNENLLSMCPDLVRLKEVNGNVVFMSEESSYVLIGIDMRNTKLLDTLLKTINGFSDSDFTFILSEVVLTYMAVNSCNGVIEWISETFQNSILSVYEQINPFDGFGQVMCTHFRKLGSPLKCILKYPTEKHQIERYKQAGFTDCLSVKASDFYRFHLSAEEKQRIENLELFDEYEPWHLKCTHYALISACKGEFSVRVMSDLYNSIDFKPKLVNQEVCATYSADSVKMEVFEAQFGVRYGHSVCRIGSRLFITGGFGEIINDQLRKHMRQVGIEIVDLNTKTVQVVFPPENTTGDRMFHSSVAWLNDEDKSLLLIFGRSNPSKLFDNLIKLNVSNEAIKVENVQLNFEPANSTFNFSRFRHATCLIHDDSALFVYGGKLFDANTQSQVLNDAFLIDRKFLVKKIPIDEEICKPRHSHSLASWRNFVVISGGVDPSENPLNEIFLLNVENFQMQKLILKNGKVLPRYSHTSHVINDHLILIGGVSFCHNPPGICFVDLNRLSAFEFDLPYELADSSPLMITSHQSQILDENHIMIIGGGGICFTFGTHLNKQPIILNISDCWSKLISASF